MTSTSVKKNNGLPPALVSNLQQVLLAKKGREESEQPPSSTDTDSSEPSASAPEENSAEDCSKPIILVTNGDGIDSPGLTYLVEALVREGLYNVHVCAPQSWVTLSLFLSLYCCICFVFL